MKLNKEMLGEIVRIEAIKDINEWDDAVRDFEKKYDCDFQAPCSEAARRLYEGWDVLQNASENEFAGDRTVGIIKRLIGGDDA